MSVSTILHGIVDTEIEYLSYLLKAHMMLNWKLSFEKSGFLIFYQVTFYCNLHKKLCITWK